MNSTATSTRPPPHPRPHLRLVGDTETARTDLCPCEHKPAPKQPAIGVPPVQVLVVGADTSTRSLMLAELRNLLPASTCFLEAREIWEVLARASSSQMVVLVDDLGDLSSSSLVRLLARRQPALPVLAVGGEAPTHANTANV